MNETNQSMMIKKRCRFHNLDHIYIVTQFWHNIDHRSILMIFIVFIHNKNHHTNWPLRKVHSIKVSQPREKLCARNCILTNNNNAIVATWTIIANMTMSTEPFKLLGKIWFELQWKYKWMTSDHWFVHQLNHRLKFPNC